MRRETERLLMYRPSDPQKPLFDAGGLLPPDKRERCESRWAGPFRRQALPILRRVEEEFADLYDPEMGRPNRPVELVLGVLILKEMGDLTDQEALDALEYDVRWWYALEREPQELPLCQKTRHNFRTGLLEHPDTEKKKLAFRRVTDELIVALGGKVDRQRLDSTHLLSNIALRNRLGMFCDVVRSFLGAVKKRDGKAYEAIPEGLRQRYALERRYEDAKQKDRPRRLEVIARDVGRLVERFRDDATVSKGEEFELLERLLREQCVVTPKPQEPKKDDDDQGEGGVPVALKEASEVGSDSLQSAHDADVTYNAKKGKGYEVQIAETCAEGNDVQMITDVSVTRSCESDQRATVPMVKAVEEAEWKPKEVVADTAYSGGENAAALARKGVNLLAPAAVTGKPQPGKIYEAPAMECPKETPEAIEWLRQQEASPDFKSRYSIRSGIESTNAELKGKHGMRKLRVRGAERVKISVYFKALACNLKRALRTWLARTRVAEGAAALA